MPSAVIRCQRLDGPGWLGLIETTSYAGCLGAASLRPPVTDCTLATAEASEGSVMLIPSAKVHILRIKSNTPFLGASNLTGEASLAAKPSRRAWQSRASSCPSRRTYLWVGGEKVAARQAPVKWSDTLPFPNIRPGPSPNLAEILGWRRLGGHPGVMCEVMPRAAVIILVFFTS
jgi:hypothetical protein